MEDEIQALEKVLNTIIDFFVNYRFQVAGAILVSMSSVDLGKVPDNEAMGWI